jgi:hypothetical protein
MLQLLEELPQERPMKLLIKFPTRGRPRVFRDTFQKYIDYQSGKHEVQFVLTMDVDDGSMNTPEQLEFINSKPNVTYCFGRSNTKVEAINANMEGHEFDVLLLASDDMVPQVMGYDDIILSNMEKYYPDTDGVLHFNDARTGRGLNTLSIMGKKMYDHFGYIYHPDYKSLWCVTGESRVYMADHTHKPIRDVKVGDMVVGSVRRQGKKSSKSLEYLQPALVTAVHSRMAQVFRVTLESGAVIRCTDDHQWAYYGDGIEDKKYPGDGSSYRYGPIKENRSLVRAFAMPADLPEKAEREMGWLAGMYDGEGSFPGITQSLTKNPENCAELERVLTKYGFNFVVKAYDRAKWNLASPKSDIMHVYWLNGGRDEYIKFLTWTKPVRTNRYQVNKRLFTARFGRPDKIVSIEPEIIQPVHCITTETGNFIVEGLLSHNCDNEFHDVTYGMNKATYIDEVIIKHGWTDVTGNDHLARRNNALYDRDRRMYQLRQKSGFPKESVGEVAMDAELTREQRRDKAWRDSLRRP